MFYHNHFRKEWMEWDINELFGETENTEPNPTYADGCSSTKFRTNGISKFQRCIIQGLKNMHERLVLWCSVNLLVKFVWNIAFIKSVQDSGQSISVQVCFNVFLLVIPMVSTPADRKSNLYTDVSSVQHVQHTILHPGSHCQRTGVLVNAHCIPWSIKMAIPLPWRVCITGHLCRVKWRHPDPSARRTGRCWIWNWQNGSTNPMCDNQ